MLEAGKNVGQGGARPRWVACGEGAQRFPLDVLDCDRARCSDVAVDVHDARKGWVAIDEEGDLAGERFAVERVGAGLQYDKAVLEYVAREGDAFTKPRLRGIARVPKRCNDSDTVAYSSYS